MTISDKIKKQVLERKIEQLEVDYYSVQLDLEVAEDIGNEQLKESSMEKLKALKGAIKLLEGKKE